VHGYLVASFKAHVIASPAGRHPVDAKDLFLDLDVELLAQLDGRQRCHHFRQVAWMDFVKVIQAVDELHSFAVENCPIR